MYRDARVMLCPRCGDMLERMLDSVHSCARCEGVWLEQRAVARAFGTPQFPIGPSLWWRRELACPVCSSVMTAVKVATLFVDRCAAHGLWLDHGELGRFLGAPTVLELDELHRLLAPGAPTPAALVARREAHRAELELKQKELEAYRAHLAAEQQRLAEERARQERRIADERRAAERKRLEDLRATAAREVSTTARDLSALREQVRALENTLEAARGRLLEIERAIEQLE